MAQSITSVEIYHTGHNLIETRAPIRAMSFATLSGKPYLVAAYMCTPLVTIPLQDLPSSPAANAVIPFTVVSPGFRVRSVR